jgi:hypothetical protein
MDAVRERHPNVRARATGRRACSRAQVALLVAFPVSLLTFLAAFILALLWFLRGFLALRSFVLALRPRCLLLTLGRPLLGLLRLKLGYGFLRGSLALRPFVLNLRPR